MIFDGEFKEVIKDYKINHNWLTTKISFAGCIICLYICIYSFDHLYYIIFCFKMNVTLKKLILFKMNIIFNF